MGEAKKRGNIEQRVKEGIDKVAAEKRKRKEEEEAYEASLTQEQKDHRKKSRLFISSLLAISLAGMAK